jgi:hypothetical protein
METEVLGRDRGFARQDVIAQAVVFTHYSTPETLAALYDAVKHMEDTEECLESGMMGFWGARR